MLRFLRGRECPVTALPAFLEVREQPPD